MVPGGQAGDAVDIRLDFGTASSPVAAGWTRISPDRPDDALFRWVLPPTEAVDTDHGYPLDALDRDGVRFTRDKPLEFLVDVPEGDFDLRALLGERSDAWRPGMFLEVNGERVISAVYGFIGMPMWTRARIHHPGGPLRVRLGVDRPTNATGALLGLGIHSAQNGPFRPHQEGAASWRSSIRWIASEKIRMVYGISEQRQFDKDSGTFRDTTRALWKRATEIGMNCVAAPFDPDMGGYFAKAGMRFFHVIHFATGESFSHKEKDFDPNVLFDGRVDNRPNPLDVRAWEDLVVKEALKAWKASQESGAPLAGVLIDLEMYGAQHMEVYHNACGFDERSFGDFCKANPSLVADPKALPPKERFQVLLKAGKLQAYYRFLEDRMAEVARRIERQIHKEAPDLLIGYLQHFDNWVFRGLDRGLGTPDMPTLAFGENTYYGYSGDAPFTQDALDAIPSHVLYVVGLWPPQFHPEKLWKDAFLAAVEASGFWVFGFDTPMKPEEARAIDAALLRANTALTTSLRDGIWPDLGTINHTLKSPFLKDKPDDPQAAVDGDPHPTRNLPLPQWAPNALKFDFGLPDSPLAEGWTRVVSLDAFGAGRPFGWERPPHHGFDRTVAAEEVLPNPSDAALLGDGIATEGENAFLVRVPPGRYRVSVLLGDLAKEEFRTHQNVTVNGISLAKNVTTNNQEYRVFRADAIPDDQGLLRVDVEGHGAQRQVVLMGIVIEPESP